MELMLFPCNSLSKRDKAQNINNWLKRFPANSFEYVDKYFKMKKHHKVSTKFLFFFKLIFPSKQLYMCTLYSIYKWNFINHYNTLRKMYFIGNFLAALWIHTITINNLHLQNFKMNQSRESSSRNWRNGIVADIPARLI